MSSNATLKMIESLNLKPTEVQEIIDNLMERHRHRARLDALVFADLLISTLIVAKHNDKSIIEDAARLLEKIRTTATVG
jgi:hypothetical protein